MIEFEFDKYCFGCGSCEKVCPRNAIVMTENKEGFLIPEVNIEKCTNCKACSLKCPYLNNGDVDKSLKKQKAFAVKNKDIEELKQSSSGGFFSIIANYIFKNNGIVYGCAFNENLVAEHIGIEKREELYKLRGSKYVQSDLKNTYKEAKESLLKERLVLYTGTPCQVAGLKNYLGKKFDNLITLDLICHGVPSPKLFKKYIENISKKHKAKILEFYFRDKKKNDWGINYNYSYKYKHKNKYGNAKINPYYKIFLEGTAYRECCYTCKYANMNRVGDITIGDYWGIEIEHPNFYDDRGVSAVIINTELGEQIFSEIIDKIEYIESSIEKVKKHNHNLKEPTNRNKIRDNIYKNLGCKDFNRYVKEDLKFKKTIKDIIIDKMPIKLTKYLKSKIRKIKGKKII